MPQQQKCRTEGDDLVAAKAFVASAQPHIDVLISIDRFDRVLARQSIRAVIDMSLPVSARAVIRSGDQALELLAQEASQPQVDSAFMTLHKLIGQYAEGLEEVTQSVTLLSESFIIDDSRDETVDVEPQAKENNSNFLTDSVQGDSPQSAKTSDTLEDLRPKHNMAVETLESVLAFEKSPALQAALRRLMVVDPSILRTKNAQVAFKLMMPSVTHSALKEARQSGKTVSVSYLDNEIMIPEAHVETLQAHVKDLTVCLVRHSLEVPDVRRCRGESSTGQISITVTEDRHDLKVVLSCGGKALPVSLHDNFEAPAGPYSIDAKRTDEGAQFTLTVSRQALEHPVLSPMTSSDTQKMDVGVAPHVYSSQKQAVA